MAISTDILLVLTCRPTFGFGYASAAYEVTDHGAVFTHPDGPEGLVLVVQGKTKKLPERDQWAVGPGPVTVVIQYSSQYQQEKESLSLSLPDGQRVKHVTEQFWKDSLLPYQGRWDEHYRRSLLTVRGLTYRTNGAMLAASTTSLPEAVGETRQWDYRFVWVRDGSYGAEALLMAGDPVACRQFIEFLLNTIDLVEKPFTSPFYRVDGTVTQGERDLLWLAGYKNSRPVRVGNAASSQLQLDIEGDFLWTVFLYWRVTQDKTFIRDYWWAVCALVNWVSEFWEREDASLWEFRDDDDHYTHSQVMCWVAVSVGAELAREALGDGMQAEAWQKAADTMKQTIWRQQQESGLPYFTQGKKHPYVDAALLTLPLYGFVEVNDPIFQNTVREIESHLLRDGLVFRYERDNMGHARHPFTLAGFWLARVYLRMGAFQQADELIARQLYFTTNLGLFAEHVDPETGEPHGNFPQLFPHAALITTLIEREEALKGGPLHSLARPRE